jgi:hypothetical protein
MDKYGRTPHEDEETDPGHDRIRWEDARWFHALSRAIGVSPEDIVTTIIAYHLLETKIEDAHRKGVL